jgi:hypothetical protein
MVGRLRWSRGFAVELIYVIDPRAERLVEVA